MLLSHKKIDLISHCFLCVVDSFNALFCAFIYFLTARLKFSCPVRSARHQWVRNCYVVLADVSCVRYAVCQCRRATGFDAFGVTNTAHNNNNNNNNNNNIIIIIINS